MDCADADDQDPVNPPPEDSDSDDDGDENTNVLVSVGMIGDGKERFFRYSWPETKPGDMKYLFVAEGDCRASSSWVQQSRADQFGVVCLIPERDTPYPYQGRWQFPNQNRGKLKNYFNQCREEDSNDIAYMNAVWAKLKDMGTSPDGNSYVTGFSQSSAFSTYLAYCQYRRQNQFNFAGVANAGSGLKYAGDGLEWPEPHDADCEDCHVFPLQPGSWPRPGRGGRGRRRRKGRSRGFPGSQYHKTCIYNSGNDPRPAPNDYFYQSALQLEDTLSARGMPFESTYYCGQDDTGHSPNDQMYEAAVRCMGMLDSSRHKTTAAGTRC